MVQEKKRGGPWRGKTQEEIRRLQWKRSGREEHETVSERGQCRAKERQVQGRVDDAQARMTNNSQIRMCTRKLRTEVNRGRCTKT